MRAAAAAAPVIDAPRVVNVPLGDRSYPIYIGPGLLDDGARLRQHIPGNTALVVTNETIAPLYLQRRVACRGAGSALQRASRLLRTHASGSCAAAAAKWAARACVARSDSATPLFARAALSLRCPRAAASAWSPACCATASSTKRWRS
jgi:hypothetical protein